MKSVVTGGAGFIGSHLSERLCLEGDEVLVIDNFLSGDRRVPVVERAGATVVEMDIRHETVVNELTDFHPERVFHLAAQIDVRRSVADPIFDAETNVIGSLRLLEAARDLGARFIYTSSGGAIYGELGENEAPFSETHEGFPNSPYGISKKVGEYYLRFYASVHGVEFVSLALGNVYGPGQDPRGEAGVVAIFGNALLEGKPCVIFGDGKQTRDYVYVQDVVDAFVAAGSKGEGETFNIGTGIETSVLELHRLMSDLAGGSSEARFEPERPGELQRASIDVSKAREGLNWSAKTPLAEGIRETLEWLKSTERH